MKAHGQAPRRRGGFTLLEVLLASALVLIVLASLYNLLIYGLRTYYRGSVRAEIGQNLRLATERMKHDLLQSDASHVLYYPAARAVQDKEAVSFPMLDPDDPLHDDGSPKWTYTVVYHIEPSSPDKMRRTVFRDRDPDATVAERQAQLDAVATTNFDGVGAELTGESVDSLVLFQNLTVLSFRPNTVEFDGYNPTEERRFVTLGSAPLVSGDNSFTFYPVTNHPDATSFDLGFDTFTGTRSGPREAERIPTDAGLTTNGVASNVVTYGAGVFSGHEYRRFDAGGTNGAMTLTIYNDLWLEENFSDGVIGYDELIASWDTNANDVVLKMLPSNTVWTAEAQVQSPMVPPASSMEYMWSRNDTWRMIIEGNFIERRGAQARLRLRSFWWPWDGPGPGFENRLEELYIMRQASGPDGVPGTRTQLTFSSAENLAVDETNTIVRWTGAIWSDWFELADGSEIDPAENYIVSFGVSFQRTLGENPGWQWLQRAGPAPAGAALAYKIDATNAAPADYVVSSAPAATWPSLYTIEAMDLTVPEEATWLSRVVDTKLDFPEFDLFEWEIEDSPDGSLTLRLATADSPDDLPAATNVAAWVVFGGVDNPGATHANVSSLVGTGRYVQVAVDFVADPVDVGLEIPLTLESDMLRSLTLAWPGGEVVADVSAVLATGPDRGLYAVDVNGQALQRTLDIHLGLYKDFLGTTQTAEMYTQIQPRNSFAE